MKAATAFIILFNMVITAGVHSLELMDSSQVKPGMKGYGLSVFRGWEPEPFGVEIIDVIRGVNANGDMILARLSGQGLEKSGVIAGMSGSPVYLSNADGVYLAGAVAYAWPSAVMPICGIQPIFQMLREKTLSVTAGPGTPGRMATPLFSGGFEIPVMDFMISNYPGLKDYEKLDKSPGLFLASSAASRRPDGPKSFKPGDAVAVNLVDGDFLVQGVGTVTHVSNQDVFIFGHPMDQSGISRLPVSRSYIYTVLPSSYLSFKMGASSDPIGSTVYDGNSAVYCRTGEQPDMVVVNIRVRSESATVMKKLRIVNDKGYFPMLAASALWSTVLTAAGINEDRRYFVDYSVRVKAGESEKTVSNTLVYAFSQGFFNVYAMAMDLANLFSQLYYSDILSITPVSLDIEVRTEYAAGYYVLTGAYLDKAACRQGDVLWCTAVLKNWRGPVTNIRIPLVIPGGTPPGNYRVLVGNEYFVNAETAKAFPRYNTFMNSTDYFNALSRKSDIRIIRAAALLQQSGAWLDGYRLESFPQGVSRLFSGAGDTVNPMPYPADVSRADLLDKAVFGGMALNFTVLPQKKQNLE